MIKLSFVLKSEKIVTIEEGKTSLDPLIIKSCKNF